MAETQTTDAATRPAALDREYVVGSGAWWYRGRQTRGLALPWAIDDVTADFGDDLYDRMALDAQVNACDTLLRAAILEDGITLSPAVDEAGADGYEQAAEYVTFCEDQLDDLETAADDVLWDMLGSLGRGSRVAEITYWPMDMSPLPGRAVLRSLLVKPREATAFVVDAYMRTLGMLARQEDLPGGANPGMLIDPADARVIDREKFAVATFHPVNNDPRGTSIYRAAYTPWWAKMQTWQEFLKYLAQFATPSIVGTTAENAQKGTDLYTGAPVDAVTALFQRLTQFQNSSVLAGAHGMEVELLFSQGEGKAFLNAFSLFNQEITKAITTQTLASNEGENGTRAQATVHQDALDTIIRQAKRSMCRMLRRDVLRNCIRYNYGDQAARLTPRVSLGEVEQEDIAKVWSSVAQLESSGYLHPSQLAALDKRVGLPVRVLEEEPAPETPGQPSQPSDTQGTTVQAMDEDPSLTNLRTAAAGSLIRSGFNPQDARAVVGLPPLRHTGRVSVATKPPEQEQQS